MRDHDPAARPLSSRRTLTGAALLAGCGVYLLAEAVAAAAWRNPHYNYLRNYVSDLGAVAGTGIHLSPLAWVFNTGILLSEAMMLAALALLSPLLRGNGWRRAVMILATLHGLGSIIVALVHSAPGTAAGTPRLHVIGAYLAIAGGNLALCAIGIGALKQRAPPWFALPLLLGLGGIGGAAALLASKALAAGLFERVAVDSIIVGEASLGAMIFAGWMRSEA